MVAPPKARAHTWHVSAQRYGVLVQRLSALCDVSSGIMHLLATQADAPATKHIEDHLVVGRFNTMISRLIAETCSQPSGPLPAFLARRFALSSMQLKPQSSNAAANFSRSDLPEITAACSAFEPQSAPAFSEAMPGQQPRCGGPTQLPPWTHGMLHRSLFSTQPSRAQNPWLSFHTSRTAMPLLPEHTHRYFSSKREESHDQTTSSSNSTTSDPDTAAQGQDSTQPGTSQAAPLSSDVDYVGPLADQHKLLKVRAECEDAKAC